MLCVPPTLQSRNFELKETLARAAAGEAAASASLRQAENECARLSSALSCVQAEAEGLRREREGLSSEASRLHHAVGQLETGREHNISAIAEYGSPPHFGVFCVLR